LIAIIGLLIVIGAIIGGYLMEHGILLLLYQPAEFVIIAGAGLGVILISAPMSTIKLMVQQLSGLTKSGPTTNDYMELMRIIQELLNLSRREGLLALESHVEAPESSEIFKKYPSFHRRHHAVKFFCDTLRLILTGPQIQPHELEALIDMDLEIHHEEQMKPSSIIQTVGDSMPGFGIVAAVLGVVLTMQAISGEIEVVGEKVGAALVGTFLGVLLCYGFFGPLAANLASKVEAEAQYYAALKQVLLAIHNGSSSAVALEFARRTIGNDIRPGFSDIADAAAAASSGGDKR